MKMRILRPTMAAIALCVAASSARAELPANYLKRWDDPAVQKRIDAGIEKNRKAGRRVVDRRRRRQTAGRGRREDRPEVARIPLRLQHLRARADEGEGAGLRRLFPQAVQFRHHGLLLGRLRTGAREASIRRVERGHLAPTAARPRGGLRQEARPHAQGPPAGLAQRRPQPGLDAQGPREAQGSLPQAVQGDRRAVRRRHPHLGRRQRVAGLLEGLPAVLGRPARQPAVRRLGLHRGAEVLPARQPHHDQRRDHL